MSVLFIQLTTNWSEKMDWSKKNSGLIKKLDSKQRLDEYQIDTLFEHMNIKGNETILDVGAGTGAFTIPLSKKLINGRVIAIDIGCPMLDIIEDKAKSMDIHNVYTTLFNGSIPVEINTADKVFACVVLHEINDKQKFLSLYKDCLIENGSIYIIEFNGSKRSINDISGTKRPFIVSEHTEDLLINCGYKEVKTVFKNELIYMTVGKK
jgi:ubiquinone/menaquinone biosynthesis C-methylase UbiE